MSNNDEEYLRLPHGMFDRNSEFVRKEREILNKHDENGRKIGCEVKKYTPLGYSETYQRATNAANEKVYKFESKTGKSLMLSSDSTPSIFREYLASGETKSKRISFVAPLFRYRNSHSRHFTQIGYAIINEPKDDTCNIDTKIVELGKGMIELFNSMGIKANICINDYRALRTMLSNDFSEDKLPEILYKLQFSSLEERIKFFNENIGNSQRRQQLIKLFSMKPVQINGLDVSDNSLELPDEYLEIYNMAKAISTVSDVKIIFDPTNLHSIETLDNYALRFVTEKGQHLGDGGEYTSYAQKYDDRITSYWSAASGVEAIERNSPLRAQIEKMRKVALFNTDASSMFALQTLKRIEDNGYSAVYQGKVAKIGKAIKKLDDNYTDIAIIGKSEEEGQDIKIRNLQTREETILDKKGKNDKTTDITPQSSMIAKEIVGVMSKYFQTNQFDREHLLEIIARHSNSNKDITLSAEDVEQLIVMIGEIYKEKGILKEKEEDSRSIDKEV